MAGLENILMGVSYLHPFFSAKFSASAICLILRCCGSGVGAVVAICGAECAARSCGAVEKCTSQPTMQIFKLIFGECNLHGAIDFAGLRSEVGGVERMAGLGL